MKKQIDVFDYAGPICKAMKKGVLLTTKAGERVNTMTIGWGTIGMEWNRPIFIAYVRETRYTKQLLEKAENLRLISLMETLTAKFLVTAEKCPAVIPIKSVIWD